MLAVKIALIGLQIVAVCLLVVAVRRSRRAVLKPRYRCTNCGTNEIAARALGCPKGQATCPMEVVCPQEKARIEKLSGELL